ncbi:hypothetical protein M885DRAFT_610540 [Pelagophyceae sp. CCMP2097]|nr:hypothetical protein M885DRAFT_610540 [Pelagophyceae sp. CCMP2097]
MAFAAGSAVEACYGGAGGQWFPGKVSAAHADGTYDVLYDDGDVSNGLASAHVRALSAATVAAALTQVVVGAIVECRYKASPDFFPGTISRNNGDSFNVQYDDGDAETKVLRRRIRFPGQRQRRLIQEGETVDAMHSTGTYRAASVLSVDGDDSYTVKFDYGGDVEQLHRKSIFGEFSTPDAAPADAAPEAAQTLAVGTAVEALYRGKPGQDWYTGTISAVNGDETYEIAYDDGDKDSKMATEHVRALSAEPSEAPPLTATPLAVGTAVEALYRNKPGQDWFPGVISFVNGDGSYEILYDDGDSDSNMPPVHVRAVPAAPFTAAPAALAVGTTVEALYRGLAGQEWYKGTISAVNSDGTYEMLYDDGETESGMTAAHVRALTGAFRPTLSVGAVLECRYSTKPKFYPGTIAAVQGDTFMIQYDDGEREAGVCKRRLRLPGQKQRAKLAEGESVDARSESGKVLPGVVARAETRSVTLDGQQVEETVYLVRFNDGEEASDLERKYIFAEFVWPDEADEAPASMQPADEPAAEEPANAKPAAADAEFEPVWQTPVVPAAADAEFEPVWQTPVVIEASDSDDEALTSPQPAEEPAAEEPANAEAQFMMPAMPVIDEAWDDEAPASAASPEPTSPEANARSPEPEARSPVSAPSQSYAVVEVGDDGSVVEVGDDGSRVSADANPVSAAASGAAPAASYLGRVHETAAEDEKLPRSTDQGLLVISSGSKRAISAKPEAKPEAATAPARRTAPPWQPAVYDGLESPQSREARLDAPRRGDVVVEGVVDGDAGILKHWDERDAAIVVRPPGSSGVGGAAGLVYTPCGRVLASAHRSRVALWVARSGARIGDLVGHTGRVLALESGRVCKKAWPGREGSSGSRAVLVSGGSDGLACVWLLPDDSRLDADDMEDDDDGLEAAWHEFARKATSKRGPDVGAKRSWERLAPVAKHKHPRGAWVLGVDVCMGGLVATSASDALVRIFHAVCGGAAPLRVLSGHGWYATDCKFAPGDGSTLALASASMDKTIRVWFFSEENNGQVLDGDGTLVVAAPPHASRKYASKRADDDSFASSTISRSSTALFVAPGTPGARRRAEGAAPPPPEQTPHRVLHHDVAVHSLRWRLGRVGWSADGSTLYAGGDVGPPVAWRFQKGLKAAPVRLPEPAPSKANRVDEVGHANAVVGVAASRDGAFFVTASHDGTARFWHVLDDADSAPKLLHVISCARTGGRFVGVAVDDGALGLSACGVRKRRARVATLSADGAVRTWLAPKAAVALTEQRAALFSRFDVAQGLNAQALRNSTLASLLSARRRYSAPESGVDEGDLARGLRLLIRAAMRALPRGCVKASADSAVAKPKKSRRRADAEYSTVAANELASTLLSGESSYGAIVELLSESALVANAAVRCVAQLDAVEPGKLMAKVVQRQRFDAKPLAPKARRWRLVVDGGGKKSADLADLQKIVDASGLAEAADCALIFEKKPDGFYVRLQPFTQAAVPWDWVYEQLLDVNEQLLAVKAVDRNGPLKHQGSSSIKAAESGIKAADRGGSVRPADKDGAMKPVDRGGAMKQAGLKREHSASSLREAPAARPTARQVPSNDVVEWTIVRASRSVSARHVQAALDAANIDVGGELAVVEEAGEDDLVLRITTATSAGFPAAWLLEELVAVFEKHPALVAQVHDRSPRKSGAKRRKTAAATKRWRLLPAAPSLDAAAVQAVIDAADLDVQGFTVSVVEKSGDVFLDLSASGPEPSWDWLGEQFLDVFEKSGLVRALQRDGDDPATTGGAAATGAPTAVPTPSPTSLPRATPTAQPSGAPRGRPTAAPTPVPTATTSATTTKLWRVLPAAPGLLAAAVQAVVDAANLDVDGLDVTVVEKSGDLHLSLTAVGPEPPWDWLHETLLDAFEESGLVRALEREGDGLASGQATSGASATKLWRLVPVAAGLDSAAVWAVVEAWRALPRAHRDRGRASLGLAPRDTARRLRGVVPHPRIKTGRRRAGRPHGERCGGGTCGAAVRALGARLAGRRIPFHRVPAAEASGRLCGRGALVQHRSRHKKRRHALRDGHFGAKVPL